MVIRDTTDYDGQTARLLIPQIEHARVAGELARRWSLDGVRIDRELLAAIIHHDDGWGAWDESPQTDPASGRVRSFTEMPLADSLAIWSESIAAVERIGPLAAWTVAGHFVALLERSTDADRPTARAWLVDYKRRQDDWLLARQQGVRSDATLEMAQQFLAWLQNFDALSLWLCCTPRSEPFELQTPAGRNVKISQASETSLHVYQVMCDPMPFDASPLVLEAEGRLHTAESDTPPSLGSLPKRRLAWSFAGPC